MKKTHLGLLAAFVLFFPNPLFALPPTELAHGIIVKFRNASKNTYAKRDQLHKQQGMVLVYRPKRSPYDFVLPKETDQQRDFVQLAKLCETYQSASVVAECEINYDLLTRNKSGETPQGAPPVVDVCSLNSTYENPLLKNGTLTPFWAQELSGADLAAFPKNAARMGVAVKVAILDQGFGEQPAAFQKKMVSSLLPGTSEGTHGALSLGLLTGPVPFTLQAPLEVTHLFEVRSHADYLKVLDTLEEKGAPSVIEIAVGLGHQSNAVKEVLHRLAKRSVLVAAASNEWPLESDRNENTFPGILVGSLTPEGYPSAISASGAQVTVSAPSDRLLQSTLDGKKAENFGGTSGASAMVAGAVAGARALVPDLTADEIKTLLTKTAIPTPGAANGGSGSLNTVGFLAVADRIRAQGLAGPQRTKAMAAEAGTKLYQFEKEAEMEIGKAAPVITQAKATCESRKLAFAQVRRAFFLQPTGTAQSVLVDLYKSQGLNTNARFPESLDKTALMKNLAEDIASPEMTTRISAARAAGALGTGGIDLIVKYAESNVRAPASDVGGVTLSTGAALKAIARNMKPEDKKALGARLKTLGNEDLEKLGSEILSP